MGSHAEIRLADLQVGCQLFKKSGRTRGTLRGPALPMWRQRISYTEAHHREAMPHQPVA